jgi:hypothetical protein
MPLAPETHAMAIAKLLLAVTLADPLVRVLASRTGDWPWPFRDDHSAGTIAQVEAGD